MARSLRWGWFLLLVLSACAPAVEPTATPEPILYDDAPYVQYGGDLRRLDVTLPEEGEAPYPVVVILHGGSMGDKSDFADMGLDLNDAGYAAVRPRLRLDPLSYEDAFCALAWVHARAADYGFDRERVAVIGYAASGGGALALALADETAPRAEGCRYPAPARWVNAAVLLAPVAETNPTWDAASAPLTWLSAEDAPTLILHGAQDSIVPADLSGRLRDQLTSAGLNADLITLDGVDHYFAFYGEIGYFEAFSALRDFLATHLAADEPALNATPE